MFLCWVLFLAAVLWLDRVPPLQSTAYLCDGSLELLAGRHDVWMSRRPNVLLIMTDQERYPVPYEDERSQNSAALSCQRGST